MLTVMSRGGTFGGFPSQERAAEDEVREGSVFRKEMSKHKTFQRVERERKGYVNHTCITLINGLTIKNEK